MRIDVPISPPFRVGLLGGGGLRMCFPVPEAFGVQPSTSSDSDPDWERVIHAVSQGAGYCSSSSSPQASSSSGVDAFALDRLTGDSGRL